MKKNVRANALRTPQGISPDSMQRAQAVFRDLTMRLREHGSVQKAAAATAAATKTPIKVQNPPQGT